MTIKAIVDQFGLPVSVKCCVNSGYPIIKIIRSDEQTFTYEHNGVNFEGLHLERLDDYVKTNL